MSVLIHTDRFIGETLCSYLATHMETFYLIPSEFPIFHSPRER